MYWAMIFVMTCGSSVTDDYTNNLSITRYYIMCWAMIFVMACGSSVTDVIHTISALRDIMYWAMIFVMACGSSVTDDYTHNISITRYYIMCWAMIFVMACGSSVTDDYTHNLSITRVLCAELWYLSWRVVVHLQTIIHTISTLHGIMWWDMIFVMGCGGSVTDDYTHHLNITRYYVLSYDICHGVW